MLFTSSLPRHVTSRASHIVGTANSQSHSVLFHAKFSSPGRGICANHPSFHAWTSRRSLMVQSSYRSGPIVTRDLSKAVWPPEGLGIEELEKVEELEKDKEEGKAARKGLRVKVSLDGHFVGGFVHLGKFTGDYEKEGVSFKVGEKGVIKGLSEGVKGMRVGSRRRLIIPPELAYGVVGSAPLIPGNATLSMEVEMLKIDEPYVRK